MGDEINNTEQRVMRSFSRFIATLADGSIEAELTEMLDKLTATIQQNAMEHGGNPSGSISLKVTFKLDGRTIDVKPAIALQLPEAPRPKTSFWVTPKNQLTLDNPQQGKLFQTVPVTPRQYKDEVG